MATEITFKSESDLELIQSMGGDKMIAGAAWASKDVRTALERARKKPEDVEGNINYLMKHRHGTPFEHNGVTFAVRAPIFVWREWHRHRIGFSYNEESARYHQMEPVFYIPPRDRPMIKIDGWKPGRPKFKTLDEAAQEHIPNKEWSVEPDKVAKSLADAKYADIIADMKQGYQDEYERYERQLARGLDPGLARDNLPVGIFSYCWVTCNARSIMAFLSLRVHDPDAMFVSYPLWEIDQVAQKVELHFAQRFPIAYAAFVKNRRIAP